MRHWRKAVLVILAAGLLGWSLQRMFAGVPMATRVDLGHHAADGSAYWLAARLMWQRQNPYDVLAVAQAQGLSAEHAARALVMRNPPWVLPLVWPLGGLSFPQAFLAWDLTAILGVLLALALLARRYALQPPWGYLPLLFVPSYLFLLIAQTSWLVLLGLAVFLRFEDAKGLEDDRAWLAGVGLFLATVKFDICFLLWPVYLLWVMDRRKWRSLAWLLGLLIVAQAGIMAWDHAVVFEYLRSLHGTKLATQQFPNLLGWLRHAVGSPWPDFVFPALGVIWAIDRYRRERDHWDWGQQLPLLVLVSLVLAPYSFLQDEVVAVIAVAAAAAIRHRPQAQRWVLLALFLAAQAVLVLMLGRHVSGDGFWYIWTPLTWLLMYLFAVRSPALRPAHAFAASDAAG